jgi:hypothetical protein
LLRVCFFFVFCVKPCSYILCAVGLLSLASAIDDDIDMTLYE